ncbi:nucleotidyltransferase [Pedobacter jejuensis]|uniref:Nucleotidyltransferase n=1 Tax=Pedobacter jejuensis TaxID=1268550 RepID=A0A3N0BR56_9SPHI|nr:nucleotidyltransferase [Pedobacter jejuensis]
MMNDPELEQFFLVGGTALSLKIGHRISIDIDLFSIQNFAPKILQDHLLWNYGSNLKVIGTGALMGLIDGVKVDFITHPYPNIRPIENIEGIRMASLQDIAAMKLNAIVGSGERIKDFVDLYYLLEKLNYSEMLNHYYQKYPNVTIDMANRSVAYHHQINMEIPIDLIDGKLQWQKVADKLINTSSQFGTEAENERNIYSGLKLKHNKEDDMGKDHGISR